MISIQNMDTYCLTVAKLNQTILSHVFLFYIQLNSATERLLNGITAINTYLEEWQKNVNDRKK